MTENISEDNILQIKEEVKKEVEIKEEVEYEGDEKIDQLLYLEEEMKRLRDNDVSENESDNHENKKRKVEILKKISDQQPKQRTSGWYKLRETRITASDVASCLRKTKDVCRPYMESFYLENYFSSSETSYCNPYSNELEFILKKKGYSTFEGSSATQWGNKFEQAIVLFYQQLEKQKILEFGLLLHPNISWLACSPDGITPKGKMIEIKCPFKRKINGIPPFYYWIQVQIQLEVCDLEECDYIEADIKVITRDEWEKTKDTVTSISHTSEGKKEEQINTKSKGILINFEKNSTYIYPGSKFYKKNKSYVDLLEWAERKCLKYKNLKPKIEYYKINGFSKVCINRDKKWFATVKPMLERTWNKVEGFDIKEYQEHIDNKKSKKDQKDNNKMFDFRTNIAECILSDDEN